MRVAASGRLTGWGIVRSPAALLVAVVAMLIASLGMPAGRAVAATDSAAMGLSAFKVQPGSKMLVEANQIVYDYDNHTVSAVGNVKLYYGGYTLEAEKVTYVQPTRRLIATGTVKLTDPSGLVTYAEQIDVTDNFSDGFVDSLHAETPQKAHFAASQAQRVGGEKTIFVNGVYTACEPCREHPEKPPLWQVSAARIILDHKEKMVYFHDAALEFLGVPIAWVPFMAAPDPSVKRKTGVLAPVAGFSDKLGWSITVPYFFAFAPNYDLTLTPSYYSKQGFLAEAEWRHRLSNGQYTIEVAGISQNDPSTFLSGIYPYQAGTYAQRTFRGGVRTTGDFGLNQYWSLGWDVTLSSDRTFTRNYKVLGDTTPITEANIADSNIHLTGISDQTYFDMRAMYFQPLTDLPHVPGAPFDPGNAFNPYWNNVYDQDRQAFAAPVIDYDRVFADPILGGQMSLKTNITTVSRNENDPFAVDVNGDGVFQPATETFYHGLAGTYTRLSTELDWQRQIIGPLGQLFTPFAYLRGDAFVLDPSGAMPPGLTTDSTAFRGMPAVGLQWSWPLLATIGDATHVIEPIAQIILRPNEQLIGQLPNDDAQSLVFDPSALFDWDKFSGFDREEGGSRVNVGVRYTGNFTNGMSLDAVFGQSFQIAGTNSFAQPDLANTGAYSGLQTPDSAYVAGASLNTGLGPRFAAMGIFDHKDFSIQRAELDATNAIGALTATVDYLYLRQDPNSGIINAQSVVGGSGSLTLVNNWRLFGSLAYDIGTRELASDSVGLALDNSCGAITIAYSESREADIPARQVTLQLVLRTLGEGNVSASIPSSPN